MPCPSALSVTRLLPATLGVFRKAYPLTTLNLFDMTPVEQYRALVNRLKETSCEQAFLSNLRPTIIRKLKSAFTLLMASQCLTFRVGGVHTKRKFKYGKELSPRGLECECTQEERSTSIIKQLVFPVPVLP